MPSKSPEQARLMAAVAHGWHPTGVKGPPVSVAKEFNQADKGSKMLSNAMRHRYQGGGSVAGQSPLGGMSPGMIQALLGQLQAQGGAPQAQQMARMMRPPPQGPIPIPMRQNTPQMMPGPRAMPTPIPGGALGQLQGPRRNIGPIGPVQHMARGGPLMPPGAMNPSPLPAPMPTRVSPLTSLMGQGMAARHAGFPGPRRPRIPMPGSLRNINQTINKPREKLRPI